MSKKQMKSEMIKAYLERDVQARVVARYAMREAEAAFKIASDEYDIAQAHIDEHLSDLGEELGYSVYPDDNGNHPKQGYSAQFDET